MWYRDRKEKEQPATIAGAAVRPEQQEAIPISTSTARPAELGSVRQGALIGKSLEITGEIRGAEDLVIDGKLNGNIELPNHCLTVGPTGFVHGKIRAREIIIQGTVQGNLEAGEKVEIRRNAKVIGDLKAQRPVIQDEAYFKGNVETIRPEPPKAAPAASAQPAAPAASPQAAVSAPAQTQAAPAQPQPSSPRQEPRKG